jgi:hypothetical protein
MWGRFTTPFSRIKTNEEELLRVQNCARFCFSTAEGEILLKHLIEMHDLDGQTGCLAQDEANYRAGQQDVVKYLLSLISED